MNLFPVLTGGNLVLGYSAKGMSLPTFGFTIVFNYGDTTTSWTGQCEMCDGTDVLLTTWVSTEKANHCRESYFTNKYAINIYLTLTNSLGPD